MRDHELRFAQSGVSAGAELNARAAHASVAKAVHYYDDDFMGNPQSFNFDVGLHHTGGKGHVLVVWPVDACSLRDFMIENFQFDPGDRNTWEAKCVVDTLLDEKNGCPSALIALRTWELQSEHEDPTRPWWKTNSKQISRLAHECFHAAEWMLKQSGHASEWMQQNPQYATRVVESKTPWEAWEDAAYLMQNIMSRTMDGLLGSKDDERSQTEKRGSKYQ